jgi:hypothetical protein
MTTATSCGTTRWRGGPANCRPLIPASYPGQGAQERSVPVKKGGIADAPDGGHNSHAGAPLEGAAVALPEDAPACGEDAERALLPSPLDRLPLPFTLAAAELPVAPFPEAPLPEVPAAAAPVIAAVDVGLPVTAELA